VEGGIFLLWRDKFFLGRTHFLREDMFNMSGLRSVEEGPLFS
jgi:hypothetical protein